ncbi:MAG: DUF3224 domain-containing protein [Pseudomonadota bacterium]
MIATGTFMVTMTPLEDTGIAGGDGAFSLSKTYEGDLAATATGRMLTAMTEHKGSQAYVAVEQVTGTLAGRTGEFKLVHRGIMDKGAPTLSVTIVPDSGEGELVGISGDLDIQIKEGTHHYVLDYQLPGAS